MTWLLWHCLTAESREKLRKYQWRWHRKRLEPPSHYPEIETLEEIDRIMRHPPASPRSLR